MYTRVVDHLKSTVSLKTTLIGYSGINRINKFYRVYNLKQYKGGNKMAGIFKAFNSTSHSIIIVKLRKL